MSEGRPRYVLDTNVLVSGLLVSGSAPGRASFIALERGVVLVSEATAEELRVVLSRPKFDRFIMREERARFLAALLRRAELIEVGEEVRACRDPKDDKFLALALAGMATMIVSGDDDLLVLHPFRGIPVVRPQAFVASQAAT